MAIHRWSYPILLLTLLLTACTRATHALPAPSAIAVGHPRSLDDQAPASPQGAPATAPVAGVPFPTVLPRAFTFGTQPLHVADLAGEVTNLAVAVHPTEGWPVIAAAQWGYTQHRYTDGNVMVAVFDPLAQHWGTLTGVNTSPVRQGAGGVAAAVGFDGTIHIMYGDGVVGHGTLWYVRSTDYGRSWSSPTAFGRGDALSAALDAHNRLHVLARDEQGGVSTLRYARLSDARWEWLGSPLPGDRLHGTIATAPTDSARTRVFVAAPTRDGDDLSVAYLDDGGSWVRQRLPIHQFIAQEHVVDLSLVTARALDGTKLVALAWSQYSAAGIFAMLSRTNGETWSGDEEVIAYQQDKYAAGWGGYQPNLAFDPRDNRLIAIWSLRDGTQNHTPWLPMASTRYLALDAWTPPLADGAPMPRPLLNGVREAAFLRAATAPNARETWLAWLGSDGEIGAASLPHDLIR